MPEAKRKKLVAPAIIETELSIGARIRQARRARGWRQEDLGDAIGVTKQRICAVEAGRENPSKKWLLRAAAALNIQPRELAPGLAMVVDLPYTPAKISMILDNSSAVPDFTRWVPVNDHDAALLHAISAGRPTTIVELVRIAAIHKVAIIFRGDLDP